MAYDQRDLAVIEGAGAIRRRPSMYIGEATADRTLCSRLVESVVGVVAADVPAPSAVRLILWAGESVTVAFDGEPLPIRSRRAGGISHPELYRMFLVISAPPTERPLSFGAAIVSALTERLVVSTVHDDTRYRAAFSRGGLVSLLARCSTDERLGTAWLTFKPDADVVPGVIDFAEAEAIAARVSAVTPSVRIEAVDRSGEKPDWW